jgi:hypothetical protein
MGSATSRRRASDARLRSEISRFTMMSLWGWPSAFLTTLEVDSNARQNEGTQPQVTSSVTANAIPQSHHSLLSIRRNFADRLSPPDPFASEFGRYCRLHKTPVSIVSAGSPCWKRPTCVVLPNHTHIQLQAARCQPSANGDLVRPKSLKGRRDPVRIALREGTSAFTLCQFEPRVPVRNNIRSECHPGLVERAADVWYDITYEARSCMAPALLARGAGRRANRLRLRLKNRRRPGPSEGTRDTRHLDGRNWRGQSSGKSNTWKGV